MVRHEGPGPDPGEPLVFRGRNRWGFTGYPIVTEKDKGTG